MLSEHDQCSNINELAIIRATLVVFVVQLLFNNGSEVANATHNTALFVHFKGQSSIIRSLGHILTCREMAFTQSVH